MITTPRISLDHYFYFCFLAFNLSWECYLVFLIPHCKRWRPLTSAQRALAIVVLHWLYSIQTVNRAESDYTTRCSSRSQRNYGVNHDKRSQERWGWERPAECGSRQQLLLGWHAILLSSHVFMLLLHVPLSGFFSTFFFVFQIIVHFSFFHLNKIYQISYVPVASQNHCVKTVYEDK